MALGPVLAAALALGLPTRNRALYIGGQDVLFTGTPGSAIGVPIESCHVTEAGPSAISSMTFSVDDPALAMSISEGQFIRFMDLANDAPLFAGYIQSYTVRPAFGEQGRTLDVQASGVEILLDWATIGNTITHLAATISDVGFYTIPVVIQEFIGNSAMAGMLRPFISAGQSSQAAPIANSTLLPTGFNAEDVTITAGTTLRSALMTMLATIGQSDVRAPVPYVTVDYTFGLRVWKVGSQPTDYTDLTIVDTGVGAIVAEDLQYTVDASAVVRAVWVTGNAGVRVYVTDGSGIPGTVDSITTTASTVPSIAGVGVQYLAAHASGVRGSYERQDHTPVATVHPGSHTIITDARVGLAAQDFLIAQIDKDFHATRDDWTVSFGNPPASAATLIRHLTRTTTS